MDILDHINCKKTLDMFSYIGYNNKKTSFTK